MKVPKLLNGIKRTQKNNTLKTFRRSNNTTLKLDRGGEKKKNNKKKNNKKKKKKKKRIKKKVLKKKVLK